jgi:hypothetical protein
MLIPEFIYSIIEAEENFKVYCNGPLPSSMFVEPVCKMETVTEIHKLSSTKARGPNGIGPTIIKSILDIIITPLTYM